MPRRKEEWTREELLDTENGGGEDVLDDFEEMDEVLGRYAYSLQRHSWNKVVRVHIGLERFGLVDEEEE